MKSIIYKSFLPKQETSKSKETHISPSSGIYRPQYNGKDLEQEDNTSQQETQQSQETVISPKNTPTGTNPSGTTIISDTNDPIYRTPVTTSRVQHQFKSSDIQVGEMQELLDRFADAGISLRITSGYRPGATTSSGNQSGHASGYALDVTPIAGQTYENLKQQLRNNPELVKGMQDNGFGIIDETTPEMQSRTGATGAHWHIGKDKLAQSGLQAILSAHHGTKLPIITARSGRRLDKQQARVTSRLYEIADREHRQQHPLTARTDKPLEPVSIASILPGTGDVAEGASIINDISKGKIGSALLGTTLFLIPGNIPQILRKRPNNVDNVIEFETFIPERLNTGGIDRTHLPEKVGDKPIVDAMLNVPIELGDAHDYGGGLFNMTQNKIVLDKNTDPQHYPEILRHEGSHGLDTQSTQPGDMLGTSQFMEVPEEILNKIPKERRQRFKEYFMITSNPETGQFTTELGPMLTQLLDYAGVKDGNKVFSGAEWNKMIDDYIKEHPHNMPILKKSIKNESLFTKGAETNSK